MRPAPRNPHTRSRWYRPTLFTLEEHLPLGGGVLGLFVGASLLSRDVPAWAGPVAAAQGPVERDMHTLAGSTAEGFTLSLRLIDAFAGRPSDVGDAGSAGAPVADGAPTRRQHGTPLPSPTRERGPEGSSSLALRANEASAPVQAVAVASAVRPSAPGSDGALLATLAGRQLAAAPATTGATPAQEAEVKESFGKLPLYFEENVGQTDASVQSFARGPGYGLFLTSTEAVMVLQPPSAPDCTFLGREGEAPAELCPPGSAGASPSQDMEPPVVVRMQLVGANAAPAVTGRDEQPGKVNYFLGSDAAKWHTNIATFGRVEYDEVYPGIDLVWYGTNRQLEYDFVVSPGTDPSVIRLNVSGAERLELDAGGDLLVHAGGQQMRQHKPFVYQEANGVRQEVASRFVLEGPQVRFALGAYDAGRPLVIDPVLSYSTYLGGSGQENEIARGAIAVDPATGDALLTGGTNSIDFPTAHAYQPTRSGCFADNCDVFVVRLRADGAALVYATYLGGNSGERGRAVAVDPATGDVLLTGNTLSTNYPTVLPLQGSWRGNWDAFLTRLRADGQALVYSTYFGGNNLDLGQALAVNPATGDALLTGTTFSSSNFPLASPLQGSLRGSTDAFVARVRADGQALVYSTYFGGSADEGGLGVAVDAATGDALITGNTGSTNFPLANPLQTCCAGDAFVARLRADGRALVYSTYLGGSGYDSANSLAVDPATGDAVLTGVTASTNFPTVNPLQGTNAGERDAFVARLRPDGQALVYSTYFGSSGVDIGGAVAVDPVRGDILLMGSTWSSVFPTVNPVQGTYGGGPSDAFVARLRADGRAVLYSTYLGGSREESALGEAAIAVDPTTGDALLTGYTNSPDFPTTPGAFDRTCGTDGNCNGNNRDAFVTRIGTAPAAYYYVYPGTEGGVSVQRGEVLYVYVLPFDANFNWIRDYRGTVTFYAPDPLSYYAPSYTFTGTEGGIGLGYVAFGSLGPQELYVWNPPVTVFGYAVYDVRP